VLVVVGVIIWNFTTKFQQQPRPVNFSEFMSSVEAGTVARVLVTGPEISGVTKAGDNFRTYAPSQYVGLVN
jgi:cell division protease FtsH